MNAADVMTREVVSVRTDCCVADIAALLLRHKITAVPVVDSAQRPIGIISESDLLRHPPQHSPQAWWLRLFGDPKVTLEEIARSHAIWASEIMTRDVISVVEEAPLALVATLLLRHRIKSAPVLRNGRLVGIVSRRDVLSGLAGTVPEDAVASST